MKPACGRLADLCLFISVVMLSGFPLHAGALNSTTDVAVYWGQNSYGTSDGPLAQKRLLDYCADSNIDIIPMAFLVQITTGPGNQPVINLSNQENDCTLFPGTGLVQCPSVGEDIRRCQQEHNKKILLSIGGATYTEGGFANRNSAIHAAHLVWNMFGPPQKAGRSRQARALRPFGAVAVDGFDFDFEATTQNLVPFARTLRSLMDKDTSRAYYLTAAPQCPYPDLADESLLSSDVRIDAVFVQFYNNGCGLPSFSNNSGTQSTFNFQTWDHWAASRPQHPKPSVFLGVPAAPTAAGQGYMSASALRPIIRYCQTFRHFGGVMMWDASQANANPGFLEDTKGMLQLRAPRRRKRNSSYTRGEVEVTQQ